ncbi:uncharacterized protein YALI1_B08207g [Yarrowia lipolytica]|uniref:Uncharacterized protein n=1 Tax=Yarrowia lipolytica TaxID=4952 RepID=A0A1D8N6N3_YARLL|nr:hypothetical protein YALI1_B08207g [Yarrowia lipolytica]
MSNSVSVLDTCPLESSQVSPKRFGPSQVVIRSTLLTVYSADLFIGASVPKRVQIGGECSKSGFRSSSQRSPGPNKAQVLTSSTVCASGSYRL